MVMLVLESDDRALEPTADDAAPAATAFPLRLVRGCGALTWVLFGAFQLLRVSDSWWRWRDDGVITLSHARGLVQFGHPAVSASGALVDGASAPLQMLLASAFYWLGGSGWRGLMDAQVLASFALAGWSAAWLCTLAFPTARVRLHIGATLAAAVLGFTAWRSVGWFGSGMENGITVALLLLAMASAVAAVTVPSTRGWLAGLAFGLAGVSRVELAGLLVPAIVVTVLALRHRPAVAVRVVGVAGTIWLAVHGWRYATFGTLIPNSAVVQDKVRIETGAMWWLAGCAGLVTAVFVVWRRTPLRVIASTVVVIVAAAASWKALHGDRYDVVGVDRLVVMTALGLVIVIAAGWMAGVARPAVWATLMAVAGVPLAQRVLFGGARLDAERISTMALPLLAVCASLVLLAAADAVDRWAHTPPEERRHVRWRRRLALTIVVVIGALGAGASYASSREDHPRSLCCGIDSYTDVLADAAVFAADHHLTAPIVATPDLGKLSFDKTVVNVDLGYLGDPMLTEIHRRRPELVDEYLTFIAAPDLVEVHGDWACVTYRRWLSSRAFEQRYHLLERGPDGGRKACPHGGARQTFVRIADTDFVAEANLSALLAAEPTHAAAAVRAAYAGCRGDDQVVRCAAVRRAVIRSIPSLRAAGVWRQVTTAAVDASPTPELERLLLTTPPRWAQLAAPAMIAQLESLRSRRA